MHKKGVGEELGERLSRALPRPGARVPMRPARALGGTMRSSDARRCPLSQIAGTCDDFMRMCGKRLSRRARCEAMPRVAAPARTRPDAPSARSRRTDAYQRYLTNLFSRIAGLCDDFMQIWETRLSRRARCEATPRVAAAARTRPDAPSARSRRSDALPLGLTRLVLANRRPVCH